MLEVAMLFFKKVLIHYLTRLLKCNRSFSHDGRTFTLLPLTLLKIYNKIFSTMAFTCRSIVLEGLSSEPSRPSPEGAFFKHVLRGRIDGPVVAFAWPSKSLWELDETFVQAQVVTDRIFPTLKCNNHFYWQT